MRIGIVVDSACDLPQDFIAAHNIVLLPITVRIGEAVLADHRDEQATLSFLHAHVAEHGAEAETIPFSVNQIRDLFLQQLVIDYDHVFCMTITKTRSPIHDNALQASFAILNDYKPVRQAAGYNSPFALRVLDTQNLFAAQAVTAVEAVRLRDSNASVQQIRERLEELAGNVHGYMVTRDLYYMRARARHKGDRSVGLLSAALGSALDIKPVLHGYRGETGPVARRCHSGCSSRPGSASTAAINGCASLPQNSSSSMARVGTPNTPAAIAASVLRRSCSLTAGSAMARSASSMPSRAAGSRSASALSAALPSRQIQSNNTSTACALAPAARHRRSADNGLNGWPGGNRRGVPSACAVHSSWR